MNDDLRRSAGPLSVGAARARDLVEQFRSLSALVARRGLAGAGGSAVPPAAGSRPNWRDRGRWKPDEIERRAANAMEIFELLLAEGRTPARAAGWAANAEGESSSGRRMDQGVAGGGRGAFQWDPPRRANFSRAFGRPFEEATIQDQLAFPQWEFANDPYERRHSAPIVRKAEASEDPAIIADAISRAYLRPREEERDAADRANLADAILRRWNARRAQGHRQIGPDRR